MPKKKKLCRSLDLVVVFGCTTWRYPKQKGEKEKKRNWDWNVKLGGFVQHWRSQWVQPGSLCRCVESPNDPYLVLDERHWPAYIELLLRCNIVLQHPDDDRRIKLVPFYLWLGFLVCLWRMVLLCAFWNESKGCLCIYAIHVVCSAL